MKKYNEVFQLNEAAVDSVADLVFSFLTESGTERKEGLRVRLSAENVLLSWMEALEEGADISLECRDFLGIASVRLKAPGEKVNPFEERENEDGIWINTMRENLESAPTFTYVHNINNVVFKIHKRKNRRFIVTAVFLFLGIIAGGLGLLLPESVRTAVSTGLLTPMSESYLTIFSFCGIPLIFLSVFMGITGVGDLRSLSESGNKMIRRFLGISLLAAVVAALIGLPFFSLTFGSGEITIQYDSLVSLVLGWIPPGIIEPFIEKNAMQLIIMGAVFGIAVLFTNQTQTALMGTVSGLNNILLAISQCFTALIPFFVFVTLVNSIWTSNLPVLLAAWKSWVITTGMQLVVILVLMLSVKRKYGPKLSVLIKKVAKTFLIGLGTNACVASIAENYNACENKLGIDPKVFSFGIPVGTTIFKPATAVRLVFLCYFMAGSQAVSISPTWVVMLVLMSVILSVATPAIPGGTLMLCPMLFLQMGMPSALVGQMLATDIFFDCICTACNQVSVQFVLINHAGSMGLLDREALCS